MFLLEDSCYILSGGLRSRIILLEDGAMAAYQRHKWLKEPWIAEHEIHVSRVGSWWFEHLLVVCVYQASPMLSEMQFVSDFRGVLVISGYRQPR